MNKLTTMKNRIITLLLICTTALACCGQSFLSKYQKLTRSDLSEFIRDWEVYSDSVASKATINDSLIRMIVRSETEIMNIEVAKEASMLHYVTRRYIKVERYDLDVDTVFAKSYLGFPSYIPEMKDEQYSVDSITPPLPQGGLYLTSDIGKKLSMFAGGLIKNDNIQKIHKKNLSEIRKYIPADYGHWGGYWWFTSFPLITDICYANNLIAVFRRTSWCTGDVIWYVKKDGKYVKRATPISSWVE